MHINPHIAVRAIRSLTGMDTHSNANGRAGRPRMLTELSLRLYRSIHRLDSAWKHNENRVALSALLMASMP
jgi:hypothetical protein